MLISKSRKTPVMDSDSVPFRTNVLADPVDSTISNLMASNTERNLVSLIGEFLW